MKAPPKCPGCGTKLEPDWETCPNCPMSFQDGPTQKTALQSDTFQSFGPPIILLGGMAYAIWTFAQYMWRTGETGMQTMSAPAKAVVGQASKAGGVVPSDSKAIQGIVNEATTGTYDPSGSVAPEEPKGEAAEEGTGTISVTAEKPPKPAKVVTEWKLRGVIRDLITLQPVAGVKVTFTDNETNSRAVVQTDAQGRYRTILPALSGRGYLVSLDKPGYLKSYLNPATEGVADMSLPRRQELVKELSTLIAEPSSVEAASDAPFVTDFHIAPK